MPSIDVAIGGLLVVLAANERFNTPPSNRSSTTAIRYHSAATAYYLIVLSAFGVIATSAQPLALLTPILPALPSGPASASPALVAAFVLGALLPRIPAIAELDQWCRQRLQEMAAIPNEVRRLTAEMRRARFAPPDDLQKQARSFVEYLGMEPAHLDFTDGPDPRSTWTKLTVLRVVLDRWEEDRKFSGFIGRFRADADEAKQRYTRLFVKAKMALQMTAGAGVPSDHRHLQAVQAYVADFRDQTTECIQAAMTLMSRALLTCDITHAARVTDLRSIGFRVGSATRRFAFDELLLVGLAAWIIILFGFICVPGLSASTRIEELIARTLMIAVIYSMAVACAVGEKERRPASLPLARVRPIGRYLLAALCASVAGLLVSFWFHVLLLGGAGPGLARIRVVYPWFVLTLLTAFMTAFCLDNAPRGALTKQRLRLLEGGVMALVMSIAAVGVRVWLFENAQQAPPAPGQYVPPPLPGVILISSCIGLFIGSCVPTWHRDAPRSTGEAGDDPDVGAAAHTPALQLVTIPVSPVAPDDARAGSYRNGEESPRAQA